MEVDIRRGPPGSSVVTWRSDIDERYADWNAVACLILNGSTLAVRAKSIPVVNRFVAEFEVVAPGQVGEVMCELRLNLWLAARGTTNWERGARHTARIERKRRRICLGSGVRRER